MNIEQWEIGKVKPFPNNARMHDEKSINAIKASIGRFSWVQPICVDKYGVVIMGHGRLEAANQLGMERVPVLVADWLTENEVAAAREADNMTQDLSEFDWNQLNINLEDIDWQDIDMTDFGFKLYGMDDLEDGFSLDVGEEPKYRTMTLHFDNPTYEYVAGILDSVTAESGNTYSDKVYEVCKQWAKR